MIIRKQFIETKEIDKQNHTVTVLVSAERVDRDKEVIRLSAWKPWLDSYLKHAIILANHESRDIQNQIGKAIDVFIVEGVGLFAKMQYFVGVGNKLADWAWYLVEQGMGGWSVGFKAHSTEPGDGEQIKLYYNETELYEISQVLVPSLREAIQRDHSLENNIEMLAIAKSVYKSGRVISSANLDKLKSAKDTLSGAIEVIDELITIASPEEKSLSQVGSNTSTIVEDEHKLLIDLKNCFEKEAN